MYAIPQAALRPWPSDPVATSTKGSFWEHKRIHINASLFIELKEKLCTARGAWSSRLTGVGCPSRSLSILRRLRRSDSFTKPASAQAAYRIGAAWPLKRGRREHYDRSNMLRVMLSSNMYTSKPWIAQSGHCTGCRGHQLYSAWCGRTAQTWPRLHCSRMWGGWGGRQRWQFQYIKLKIQTRHKTKHATVTNIDSSGTSLKILLHSLSVLAYTHQPLIFCENISTKSHHY